MMLDPVVKVISQRFQRRIRIFIIFENKSILTFPSTVHDVKIFFENEHSDLSN